MTDPLLHDVLDRLVGPTPPHHDPLPAIRRRIRHHRSKRIAGLAVAICAAAAAIGTTIALNGTSATKRSTVIVIGPSPASPTAPGPLTATEHGVTIAITFDPAIPLAGTPFDMIVRLTGARRGEINSVSSELGPLDATQTTPGPSWVTPAGDCTVADASCSRYTVELPDALQATASAQGSDPATHQAFTVTVAGQLDVAAPSGYAHLTATVNPARPRNGQTVTLTITMHAGPAPTASFRVDYGDGNTTGTGPQNCTEPTQPEQTDTSSPPRSGPADITQTFRHSWATPGVYHLTITAYENGGCVPPSGYAQQQLTLTIR